MNIKKNRTFLTWMASYVLILVIPILIGLFAYFQSIKIIYEEVNKVHDSSLRQFKLSMDGRLTEIDRISNEILLSERVKAFMSMEPPLQPEQMYPITEIQSFLNKFEVSNTNISSICIYFKKSNIFLTSSNVFRENSFTEIGERDFGMNQDEMLKLVNVAQYREYKVLKNNTVNGRAMNKIAVIQAIPGIDMKNPMATLVIFLDGEKLNASMQNLTWTSKGMLFIINRNNEYISYKKIETLPWFLQYNKLKEAENLFYENYENEDLIITHTPSDINEWRYVSVIPSRTFLQKVQYIKIMIYIYLGLCLVIGGFTAYFLTKKNYSPIRKITQLLKSDSGKSEGEEKNEFYYLEKALTNLLDEKERFKNRLEQQNETIRNNFLTKLLKGRIRDFSTVYDSSEVYGIKFSSDKFLVMIFNVEDYSRLFFEEMVEADENTVNLIFFIIRNIVEELTGEKHLGYMAEVDGMMACMVNLVSGVDEFNNSILIKDEMIQIAQKSKDFLESKMGIVVSVGISNIHSSAAGISKAYFEAVEAIEYINLVGEANTVVNYSSISNTGISSFNINYNTERERQFYNCIIAEDFKGARNIVNEIIISDFTKGQGSLQLAKFKMFGLINTILNAIGEMKTAADITLLDDIEPVNKLINCKNITELQNQMDYIFEKLNEYHTNKKMNTAPEWFNDVVNYLDNHYYEQELSAGTISQEFDVHLSSLSRIFKKHMGIGLLDYIHKKRLDKAKELMKVPGLNIKDIAEKVGYYSSLTMIRAFKRYEGTTPGRFKEKE